MAQPPLPNAPETGKAKLTSSKTKNSCSNLVRFNTLLQPGDVEQFEALAKDFCLTDIVLDLYTIPDGLNSKASAVYGLSRRLKVQVNIFSSAS